MMNPSQNLIFTYQTRLNLTQEQFVTLNAYAELYGKAERSLFAAMQKATPLNELKRLFITRFGLSARHFNDIRISLEGKIKAIKER